MPCGDNYRHGRCESMKTGALERVRVLEFADFVTAPYCAKLLADLGADVVKIEHPGTGDEARRKGPFPDDIPHPEKSGLFLYLNTNKRGVTLDPATASGRKIFLDLAARADILVEDRPPGAMADLGLAYDTLREANPRLIVTSITPFGQTGPYRTYKAYGLNICHGAGAGYLTPVEDAAEGEKGPLKGGGYFDQCSNGLSAATATLLAFYQRQMTGEGQHLDISEQEASLAYDRVEIGMYTTENYICGRVRPGGGAALSPCRDGHIIIAAVGNPKHWQALCEIMGNPPWTADERFQTDEGRFFHSLALNVLIGEWTKNHTKEELYHRLARAAIPVGAVRTQEELMKGDEQLRARGFFAEIDHPAAGRLTYPSASYRLSATPWELARPAPTLGQHNEDIYGEILGYRREDLVRLRQLGVI